MKPSITVKQKKRGGPATGVDPFVGVRFPAETLDAIDAWATESGDGVTRSEAIRRLVKLGLKAKSGKRGAGGRRRRCSKSKRKKSAFRPSRGCCKGSVSFASTVTLAWESHA